MKIFDLKKEWIIWVIIIIPFIYSAFIYNQLPEQVPVHWDWEGKPDGYSSKFSGAFLMPLMNVGLYFLLLLLPKIDPRKKNYEFFTGTYRAIRIILHGLFTVIYFITMHGAITGEFFSPKIIMVAVFLFIMLMGNYLKNIRSNFFIGIRTPWTLDNKDVWKKTHELGGKIWFYTGMVAALLIIVVHEDYILYVTIPAFIIMVIIPVVYSYFAFREIEKQNVQEE